MAITLLTDIPEYNPVYNKMEVCVDSTQKGQPSFKYIFDIVTTSFGTFRTLAPKRPDGSTNYGVQDVSQILEEFVQETISAAIQNTAYVQGSDPMIIEFHIEYGEQYDVAGTITDFPNDVTGTTKYAWSGALPHHEWIDEINEVTPFNDYLANTTNGTNAQFLTRLKTFKTSINDLGWNTLMTDVQSDIDFLRVRTFDTAGVFIAEFDINNTENMGIVPSRVLSVASHPATLNLIDNADFAVGAQPVITSSVGSYTIQAFEVTPTAVSELLTFEIEEACRYTPVRLHWINELGGLDSFNFMLRNQDSQQTQKKTYTRNKTNLTGSGIVYQHDENGTVPYYAQTRDKIKLRSDYLTTEEHRYLKELISATSVWQEFTTKDGSNDFRQVLVTNNKWTDQTNEFEKLVRLDLDIDIANLNIRQRR